MSQRIYELRNYTMNPGRRDALITLFEREFLDSQEEMGAQVDGVFRNLDDPDRFVWLRSFADMESRKAALTAFYTSPVWLVNREAANATIADNDDVLLLRPVAPIASADASASLIAAITFFPRDEDAFAAHFQDEIAPALHNENGELIASFATEHSPNTYPRLPIRENDTVFVALARFAPRTPLSAITPATGTDARLTRPTEIMRLQPTARSRLR
ncbi:MAG: NIPSNAP family protein [Pseudomonadota bacterium]